MRRSHTAEQMTLRLIVIIMGAVVLAGLIAMLSGCVVVPPPGVPPQPAPVRTIGITVRAPDGTALTGAVGQLAPDGQTGVPCENREGRLLCQTRATGGGDLAVEADGYVSQTLHIALDVFQEDLYLVPIRRALPRLVIQGRTVRTVEGARFVWQSMTAFRLVEMVATGRAAEADAFLAKAEAAGLTMVRVFSMAGSCCNAQGQPYLFRLEPAAGRAALPQLLDMAAGHGLYVEVGVLIDTRFYTFDHRAHVIEVGKVCALATNCLIDLSNEPAHGTQVGEVADPGYLAAMRALIPADVPVAWGAAHGADDFNFTWAGGDYVPIHLDRAEGEDEFTHDGKGLRWVRHIKDALDTAETLRKYTVNREPRRDDLTPWKHTAVAIICRLLGIGDTFHYGGGLQATWPEGAELAAFEGRRRGWQAIPVDWEGDFRNVGHAGSPVPEANWATVLKVFSAIQGGRGYAVALGGPGVVPSFDWAPDWPTRELVLEEGGTRLWRLAR